MRGIKQASYDVDPQGCARQISRGCRDRMPGARLGFSVQACAACSWGATRICVRPLNRRFRPCRRWLRGGIRAAPWLLRQAEMRRTQDATRSHQGLLLNLVSGPAAAIPPQVHVKGVRTDRRNRSQPSIAGSTYSKFRAGAGVKFRWRRASRFFTGSARTLPSLLHSSQTLRTTRTQGGDVHCSPVVDAQPAC